MQDIVVLFDKEDVIEFNKYNINSKNIFLISPGLEEYLKKGENFNILKFRNNPESILQKKIILNSKKIYQQFDKNLNILHKFDSGVIENIHNIFFASIFSFMFLIETLRKFKSLGLLYKKKFYKFDSFDNFIPLFLEKIFLKDNQVFFKYLRSTKLSKIKKFFIKINNQICRIGKKQNNKLISGSLLSKKILEKSQKELTIFELKPYHDFKKYHIILNLLSLLNVVKKKKIFFIFPVQDSHSSKDNIKKDLNKFFNSFEDKNFDYFKKIIVKPIIKYCENQETFKKSVSSFVDFLDPKCVFVDQLRFDVSTLLASICSKRNKDVILVPHGSISIPSDEFSEFVLPIVARGLIYSKIANYSVAQSKISYEAIKYYDSKIKILKSNPILFGKIILIKNSLKRGKFRFLHASTPKTLSAWPWIYENYNEYMDNINQLIQNLKSFKNIELVIRFREGPECDLNTFKKLIKFEQNKFIKISKNKDFFDDISNTDCLISFSSTSIEEAIFLNKKVLIHSNNRIYKHINYKFEEKSDIIYSNQKNINDKLKLIMNDSFSRNYDVLWNNTFSKKEDLQEFI